MTNKTDVIIAGAGIAGLTLAAKLANAGLSVCVLDRIDVRQLAPRQVGRTVALLRPSVATLIAAGVNPTQLPDTAPLETLELIDIAPGGAPLSQTFQASEIGEPYFGLNIVNDDVHAALVRACIAHKNIAMMAPCIIESVSPQSTYVDITTNQGAMRATLLIGADGKDSIVRQLCAITVQEKDYDQTAITCLIEHSQPHAQTSTEFHRPGGPFTLVPLSGNRSSVVWLERTSRADEIMSLSADDFTAALQTETHEARGKIKVLTKPTAWPIKWQLAHHLVAPRIALVAEAAHALPPSGAQGLNLSLRDTSALGDLVCNAARLGLDVGSTTLLAQYASGRKTDMVPRARAVDGLNQLILTDHPLLRRVRRAGLFMTANIPPVRRALMRFGWAGG
jgi:2-octaprenyl-6-methoxyphenol hydroxylase